MKIIRNGIFETNSSSTHVIAIAKENDFDLPNKKIRFAFGTYEWAKNLYTTYREKGDYLITAIYSNPGKKEEWLEKLAELFRKNEIKYHFPEPHIHSSGEYKGSIDHVSELYPLIDILLANEYMLFRFLFNNDSYITTSNDNDEGYYYKDIGVKKAYNPNDSDEDRRLQYVRFYNLVYETLDKYDYYFKGNSGGLDGLYYNDIAKTPEYSEQWYINYYGKYNGRKKKEL